MRREGDNRPIEELLLFAAARGKVSADGPEYLCPVTIAEVEEAADEIARLKAALSAAEERIGACADRWAQFHDQPHRIVLCDSDAEAFGLDGDEIGSFRYHVEDGGDGTRWAGWVLELEPEFVVTVKASGPSVP